MFTMEEEQGIDADENFVEKVESFRVDIVQTIDLERQLIFSYLRANSVLDVEDCETIMNSGSGRKQRVAKFLDVLACKGPDGYKHFVSALEIDCPQLFKKITGKNARKSKLPIVFFYHMQSSLPIFTGNSVEEIPSNNLVCGVFMYACFLLLICQPL